MNTETTQTTEVTITLSDDIKREVAEKIVESQHPAGLNGTWVTDGESLWFHEPTRAWNPEPDGVTTVPVTAFVDTVHNIFNEEGLTEGDEGWDGTVDFAEMELASAVVVSWDDNGYMDYRRVA